VYAAALNLEFRWVKQPSRLSFLTMLNDKKHNVWLITGCSSGFGLELAKQVLEGGMRVVATARRIDALKGLVEAYGDWVLAAVLDVTSQQDIDRLVGSATERFGKIDVLVNNAGYGYIGAVEEGVGAEVRRVFETNFFGLVALVKAVLPQMRERRSGRVVNFSSIGGRLAFPAVGYCNATKFAVEGMFEALCQEVEPLGIKVIVVEPGRFRTQFAGGSLELSSTIIDDYLSTAGAVRKRTVSQHGTQVGDPVKGCAAILEAVSRDEPPRRLLLGSDAYAVVTQHLEHQRQEIEFWKTLTLSTDHTSG
jgi:NAD(P)-dependent dehydrogenase (short-subunit alcohol dehydrogenase family)